MSCLCAVHVTIVCTIFQEDMDATRPESYTGADVFLLCFSVKGPTSFQNIKTKWIPELKQHAPNIPILLVGCKEGKLCLLFLCRLSGVVVTYRDHFSIVCPSVCLSVRHKTCLGFSSETTCAISSKLQTLQE
jgi:hypothetical protein